MLKRFSSASALLVLLAGCAADPSQQVFSPSPLDDVRPEQLTTPLPVSFTPDIAKASGNCDAKQHLVTHVNGVTFKLMNLAEGPSKQCPQRNFPNQVHMHYLFAYWSEDDGRHQTQLMLKPGQLPGELSNWVMQWDSAIPDTSMLDGRDLVNAVMALPIRHDQKPFSGPGGGFSYIAKHVQNDKDGFVRVTKKPKPAEPQKTASAQTKGAQTESALPYGTYDPKQIVKVTQTDADQKFSLDLTYLDTIINDLNQHAAGYPTQFASEQDKQRAKRDAYMLSRMLETMISGESVNINLLYCYAQLNHVAHNLDIKGAHEKADASYSELLTVIPNNARVNYDYGRFLANSGEPEKALGYLQKAEAQGLNHSAYLLAMTHLMLKNKTEALEHLERYLSTTPNDVEATKLAQALRSDQVTITERPGGPLGKLEPAAFTKP